MPDVEPVKVQPTLGEIHEANNTFHKLAQMNLAPKAAYRVAKLLQKITAEMKYIEGQRLELFKKHGSPDAKGDYSVGEPGKEEFLKEQAVLFALESTMSYELIPVDILTGGSLSPADMLKIDKFLTA